MKEYIVIASVSLTFAADSPEAAAETAKNELEQVLGWPTVDITEVLGA